MAGIEDLIEFAETSNPKIVDKNKIRVYRGYEKMPLKKRRILNGKRLRKLILFFG